MKTVFILMDSLNRHYLAPYGGSCVQTPNLERLAARGLTFDNHWVGSLPCMPARREIMTGRHNFLEAPWHQLEPYDQAYPEHLRQAGVHAHMITDHYHYFHAGGDAYVDTFSTWEFQRGQESDRWRPVIGAQRQSDLMERGGISYWANRSRMDTENDLDYPTPQCFQQAVEFLEINQTATDWHLQLEVFDPHEPFNCPQKYLDMYGDDWDPDPRKQFDWPQYAPVTEDEATVRHVRNSYAATLTMADHWLGTFLDKMDELDAWKDTTVILTTDHGHLLGEHGYWAKNYMFDYRELAQIPMFVAAPALPAGRRVPALTSTIDLMPTLLDLHGAEIPETVQGRSLCPVLDGADEHHDAVLYGYFGKDVSVTDGRCTYTRIPEPGAPVHAHTTTPRRGQCNADWEVGTFLPYTDWQVFRSIRESHRHHHSPDHHLLYDLEADPWQATPVNDAAREAEYIERLRARLTACQAPACQYQRLGLG
jgi:arylsulfatase A-like enzyme